ncbi:(2Fe-2S)-binding protein [Paenibacillus sp. TRM 82003]|nr:(2Fe-2S)-binding protein [Paenibacillus sp. TRM 82003]
MSVNPPSLSVPRQLNFVTADEPEPFGEGCDRLHGPTLTSPETVAELLARVSSRLQVSKPAVAASQFTKWYCRSLVAVLYEFSVDGIARSASLRDVTVLFPDEPPFAILCGGLAVAAPHDDAARESLRELTVIRLFAHNWNLVFKSLVAATGVRENILWENGAVYLHHFYRTWIEETTDERVRGRLEADYRYIVQEAPPELFGELQCFNPFQWTGKPIRSTCCLRYHLPDGNYCRGCPISNAREA